MYRISYKALKIAKIFFTNPVRHFIAFVSASK